MPSFHDVRLMEVIEQGAVGGPEYNTTIFETQGGFEQRLANWSMPRHKWNLASGLRNAQDFDALLAFFHARMGSLHGFRFKDWSDYTDGGEGVVREDPSLPGFWRLYKAYPSGPATLYRKITRPVSSTVVIAGGTDVVDYSTGIIVSLDSPPVNTTWTGQFDVPVRFQSDAFQLTLTQLDIGNAELNVQEIRE